MIGPEFPPSPKEGAWLAVCVGVLGSDLAFCGVESTLLQRGFKCAIQFSCP